MGKIPVIPKISMGMVDIRDVSEAHLKCLKKPDAAGKRFILVKETLWAPEIGKILNTHWKPKGYGPTTTEMPRFVASLMSKINP